MDSTRWDRYRPRHGDTVIATYPKCGTTWTQRIVSMLVFQSPEAKPLTISPWLDERFLGPVEDSLAVLDAQTHRRFLKSHLPFDALPHYDEVKYIHVARDGLDAMMSWHNHQISYKRMELLDRVGLADDKIGRAYPRPAQDPRQFFHDWMGLSPPERTGDMTAGSFFDLERSYWAARKSPNVLLVHYNDLIGDLDGEMRRIARFLDVAIDPTLWPALVRAATFEEMRRDGAVLMPFARAAWTAGHESFIYAGRNERWREILSEDDVSLYRERAAKELPAALDRWLILGRERFDPRTFAG